MKKIILTANGFENKNIGKMFLDLVNKKPENIKAVICTNSSNFCGSY